MADARRIASEVLDRIVEMFATGDTRAAEEVFAADYVDHQGLRGETIRGPDGFRRVVSAARGSYERLEIRASDVGTEGDKITARFVWRGFPRDRTQRPVERETVETLRIADGRVVEHWGARVS